MNNPYFAGVDLVPADPTTNWQERALCSQTDPEAFFPDAGGSARGAKRLCLACDVRDECLEYALNNDERVGVWGGLTEKERRKIKRAAMAPAASAGGAGSAA